MASNACRVREMTDQRFKVTCHCGWNVTGTRDEVVNETRAHVLKSHWTEAEEEDILEMAVPVTPEG
jgi:hypothetical protein